MQTNQAPNLRTENFYMAFDGLHVREDGKYAHDIKDTYKVHWVSLPNQTVTLFDAEVPHGATRREIENLLQNAVIAHTGNTVRNSPPMQIAFVWVPDNRRLYVITTWLTGIR